MIDQAQPRNVRCPICGKIFAEDESLPLPFCSQRCRQIDLGRWLTETYHVPVEEPPEEEELPPGPPDDHSL